MVKEKKSARKFLDLGNYLVSVDTYDTVKNKTRLSAMIRKECVILKPTLQNMSTRFLMRCALKRIEKFSKCGDRNFVKWIGNCRKSYDRRFVRYDDRVAGIDKWIEWERETIRQFLYNYKNIQLKEPPAIHPRMMIDRYIRSHPVLVVSKCVRCIVNEKIGNYKNLPKRGVK